MPFRRGTPWAVFTKYSTQASRYLRFMLPPNMLLLGFIQPGGLQGDISDSTDGLASRISLNRGKMYFLSWSMLNFFSLGSGVSLSQ